MNVNGLAEGLLHELLEKQKQQLEILAWLVEYEARQGRQPPKHVRQLGPKAEIPRTTAYGLGRTDKQPVILDARISVRVSKEAKRRATEAARRKGMGLSELVRLFLTDLANGAEAA
jgi:hypothetical protein